MKTWLKGGLWGAGVYVALAIILVISTFLSATQPEGIGLGLIILTIPSYLITGLSSPLASYFALILNIILAFIIGLIIGLIIQKIKQKR